MRGDPRRQFVVSVIDSRIPTTLGRAPHDSPCEIVAGHFPDYVSTRVTCSRSGAPILADTDPASVHASGGRRPDVTVLIKPTPALLFLHCRHSQPIQTRRSGRKSKPNFPRTTFPPPRRRADPWRPERAGDHRHSLTTELRTPSRAPTRHQGSDESLRLERGWSTGRAIRPSSRCAASQSQIKRPPHPQPSPTTAH